MSKQNPYLNARREWDERYGGLISRARNWQRIAAGSLVVTAVAVVGIAFVGSQSKIQPFVVVTDQLGSPVAVARPAPVAKSDFDKRLMVVQLATFIKDVRSMQPDAVAQQVTLNRVYAMAGRDVAGFLNGFFKENSPFSVDGSVTRVEISSVIPQGGETYQVSWVETKAKPGVNAIAEHWKAVVTVGTDAKLAENEKIALWNPFGIYVKSISWTKEAL
jgi:type IV secretion system protein VirB5